MNEDLLSDVGFNRFLKNLSQRIKYYHENIIECITCANLDGRILDVGCGPGTTTQVLAESIPTGCITGLDIDKRFINYAENEARKYNLKNVQYVTGDCYDMNFEDNIFDGCFALNLLEFLKKPVDALIEIKRVTKPNGVICIMDIDYENIIIRPAVRHSEKIVKINALLKKYKGADAYVGRKLEQYFHMADIKNIRKAKTCCDNIKNKDFINTVTYEDGDRDFLAKNRLMSEKELEEYFHDIEQLKQNAESYYCVMYDIVWGQK